MATPSHLPIPHSAIRHPVAQAVRRILELLACGAVLPLLCLTTLAMLAIIQVTSPGPVIFRQKRIGHRGREFMLFKFRTMHLGADTAVHQDHFRELVDSKAPMLKLDAAHDRRLLPGGRFLRASGLDELPQLINVLRGEMSLVGPRPCLPTEFAHYLPAQRERVDAMPGLTGLWQVSGKNHTTFEEMIRLDIEYARNSSLLLDLKIILFTPVVIAGQIAGLRTRRHAAHPAGVGPRPAFPVLDASTPLR